MLVQSAYLRAIADIVEREQPQVVIEIGAYAGASAVVLSALGATVFCVDRWQGGDDSMQHLYDLSGAARVLDAFCRNMQHKLFRNVFPVIGESSDWARRWPADLKADIVYIDAGHRYTDCATDIMAWRSHLRPGGLLMGHDYSPVYFPAVVQAVHDMLGEEPTEIWGDIWTWRKPEVLNSQESVCHAGT